MLIPLDVFLVFLTASTALALAPGPDNIFVLTQSAVHGRKAGIVVTLGLMTGVIVHSALVAVGVAAIFQTSAAAFTVLKLAGAAYLVYLAWKAFSAGATKIATDTAPSRSLKNLYGTGVIMNITNPKVAIFFRAVLPQFADPARGSVTIQVFIFGALFAASAFVIFGAVAWGAGFLGDWLVRSPRAQSTLNRVAGFVFLGLAARLLLAER